MTKQKWIEIKKISQDDSKSFVYRLKLNDDLNYLLVYYIRREDINIILVQIKYML